MGSVNRQETPPFALKLFYRNGALHRPDEFAHARLPPHVSIHTWSDCTLAELSHYLADASASGSPILPDPAIGTRLCFRLIFPNTRNPSGSTPRFATKDLGSLVIGESSERKATASVTSTEHDHGHKDEASLADVIVDDNDGDREDESEDASHTLSEARFVVGDYISCAVLPPRTSDGRVADNLLTLEVADSSNAFAPAGRADIGEGRRRFAALFGSSMASSAAGSAASRRRPGGGDGSRDYRGGSGGGGSGDWKNNNLDNAHHHSNGHGGLSRRIPAGDWRRGEQLPPPMSYSGGDGNISHRSSISNREGRHAAGPEDGGGGGWSLRNRVPLPHPVVPPGPGSSFGGRRRGDGGGGGRRGGGGRY